MWLFLGKNWKHYSLGGINIHADDDYAFRKSCEYEYVEMAKWLYSLGGIDIHANDDWEFKASCMHGHLKNGKMAILIEWNKYSYI